jgi:hypothetical protein
MFDGVPHHPQEWIAVADFVDRVFPWDRNLAATTTWMRATGRKHLVEDAR